MPSLHEENFQENEESKNKVEANEVKDGKVELSQKERCVVEGENDDRTNNRKQLKRVFLVFVLIIIIILLLLSLRRCENEESMMFGNGSVSDGALQLGDYDEIKAGLQAGVDESYMNLKINLNIEVNSETGEAILMIQNTDGNKYNAKVDIYLDNETEDHMYVSPLIKPNQFIEKDKLIAPLEKGEHKAVAIFTVLEEETNKPVNQMGVKLTLTVK